MKRPFLLAATFSAFAPAWADETPVLSRFSLHKPASTITFVERENSQGDQRTIPTLLIATPVSRAPNSLAPAPPLASLSSTQSDTSSSSLPTPTRTAPRRTASTLASRRALQQRLMLAALDADLARAEKRLQRSETRLTEGQRQLGSINNLLQAALLDTSEDARGLHPFVRVAQRYLGTPYVWGGESARGFDCSGFIMRVMRDLGYKALPHSAAEQFNYGTPISRGLLKPGDIVFFANTYKRGVSHVGIYLGRGRFIHAANSKQGTIVSGLNEPKWVQHYAGARRLVRVTS